MKHLSIILTTLFLAAALQACSSEGAGTAPEASSTIEATSLVVTPSVPLTAAKSAVPYESETSSISYHYDTESGNLNVRHSNAAFLPGGNITVRVRIEENILTIIEKQSAEPSGAVGLYDLDFVITNLPVRAYRVVVIEPYVHKNEQPLYFRMDLVESLGGSATAARTQSPWGDIASF